ncbi:hypothetical protein [Nostoc sp.]|uniref:hypothetical protein n=1 Tax=Nostoc sp. TaxID=1180 RepID=UPI002FF6B8EE
MSENFKTKKARLSAVKNNQDYQWIGELYPAVFTDDKTILFLSINKFVAQNTTLIEPSYYFSERFINKSLIFIDEFDTTKEAVLQNIIQSGLRNRVDLIDLFLNIHNHLMQTECPEVLLQESKWRKQQSSGKTGHLYENKLNHYERKLIIYSKNINYIISVNLMRISQLRKETFFFMIINSIMCWLVINV